MPDAMISICFDSNAGIRPSKPSCVHSISKPWSSAIAFIKSTSNPSSSPFSSVVSNGGNVGSIATMYASPPPHAAKLNTIISANAKTINFLDIFFIFKSSTLLLFPFSFH